MHGVRDVRLPVGNGPLLRGQSLHDASEPCKHGQTAVLEFLHLKFLEVTGFGEPEGVEAAAGGDGELQFGEGVLEQTGAVALRGTHEEDLQGEDGPERGVARAFGGEGRHGAGELVRHGGAVIGGAQGARGEPGDAGAVLRSPRARHAEHSPAAVDDLALRVLVVVKGDDGGLATAGVHAELGVQVGRGDGAELGNLWGKERVRVSDGHETKTQGSRVRPVDISTQTKTQMFVRSVPWWTRRKVRKPWCGAPR